MFRNFIFLIVLMGVCLPRVAYSVRLDGPPPQEKREEMGEYDFHGLKFVMPKSLLKRANEIKGNDKIFVPIYKNINNDKIEKSSWYTIVAYENDVKSSDDMHLVTDNRRRFVDIARFELKNTKSYKTAQDLVSKDKLDKIIQQLVCGESLDQSIYDILVKDASTPLERLSKQKYALVKILQEAKNRVLKDGKSLAFIVREAYQLKEIRDLKVYEEKLKLTEKQAVEKKNKQRQEARELLLKAEDGESVARPSPKKSTNKIKSVTPSSDDGSRTFTVNNSSSESMK